MAKKAKTSVEAKTVNARQFVQKLKTFQSAAELKKYEHYFKFSGTNPLKDDKFIGVRMGTVFKLAKEAMHMPLDEVEELLESPVHEVRAAAVSIMDFQARDKKTPASRKKELYDLYIRRHDRINNWDLVDRSAPYVVGGYLIDKPRTILYKLAKSKNVWERRTAIVSTYFFIRKGEVDDTFNIAEILVHDEHDMIHKATGSWVRTAGGKAPEKLLAFLDRYASTMPRTMLRYAIEKLNKKQKEHYMAAATQEE